MDVIERLTKQRKDLGYEGETLQTFVKEQQIELRDERKAMRETEREGAKLSVKVAKLRMLSAKLSQKLSAKRPILSVKIVRLRQNLSARN